MSNLALDQCEETSNHKHEPTWIDVLGDRTNSAVCVVVVECLRCGKRGFIDVDVSKLAWGPHKKNVDGVAHPLV